MLWKVTNAGISKCSFSHIHNSIRERTQTRGERMRASKRAQCTSNGIDERSQDSHLDIARHTGLTCHHLGVSKMKAREAHLEEEHLGQVSQRYNSRHSRISRVYYNEYADACNHGREPLITTCSSHKKRNEAEYDGWAQQKPRERGRGRVREDRRVDENKIDNMETKRTIRRSLRAQYRRLVS